MKKNFQLQEKSFAFGPFVKCPVPEMIESIALAGYSFAVVDMEHTPLGPRDLYPLKLAAEARNLDLIVRIPMGLEMYFKWCLDLGIDFVQVPFVQTKQDAENAIALSRFNPEGHRGLCRFVRNADFSTVPGTSYVPQANERSKMILQIEGIEGVKNIDDILSVPHIYGIFLGPYDLSQSLGIPGQIWDSRVTTLMKSVILKCQEKNIRLGTFTDTPEGIHFWSSLGVNFIEYASDLNIFIQASQKLLSFDK